MRLIINFDSDSSVDGDPQRDSPGLEVETHGTVPENLRHNKGPQRDSPGLEVET